MQLRDYQQECISIINSLPPGAYLSQMATGLGKTVTFANIKRRGRVLLLSHREELVTQPKKYYDCSFGIEQENFTATVKRWYLLPFRVSLDGLIISIQQILILSSVMKHITQQQIHTRKYSDIFDRDCYSDLQLPLTVRTVQD